MLLLPAKFLFYQLALKQKSKTKVELKLSAGFLPNQCCLLC